MTNITEIGTIEEVEKELQGMDLEGSMSQVKRYVRNQGHSLKADEKSPRRIVVDMVRDADDTAKLEKEILKSLKEILDKSKIIGYSYEFHHGAYPGSIAIYCEDVQKVGIAIMLASSWKRLMELFDEIKLDYARTYPFKGRDWRIEDYRADMPGSKIHSANGTLLEGVRFSLTKEY